MELALSLLRRVGGTPDAYLEIPPVQML